MTSDETRADIQTGKQSLLPQIVGVEAARVRYDRPRVYYVGRQRREASEAVEIMVRTSREMPARNLSPALFVGEVPLIEGEWVGPNLYRFFAFEFEKLREGDLISLGWPHSPEYKERTNFRYQIRRNFPVA